MANEHNLQFSTVAHGVFRNYSSLFHCTGKNNNAVDKVIVVSTVWYKVLKRSVQLSSI